MKIYVVLVIPQRIYPGKFKVVRYFSGLIS